MKISSKLLSTTIAPLAKIATRKRSLPILNSLRLQALNGHLVVRASDVDSDATELIECEGDIAPCCVSADKFFNFCKSSDGDLDIGIHGGKLKVVSQTPSKSVQNFGIIDAATFPPVRKEKLTTYGVNTADLARAIELVSWSSDPAIDAPLKKQCVHVVATDTEIKANAFSGKTIAMAEVKSIAAPFQFMVHANFTPDLCTALRRDGAQLHLCEKYLEVKHDKGCFSVPLVEVKNAPNWAQLQAHKIEDAGKIPRAKLLAAVNQCRSLAMDNDKIKLSFGAKLILESRFEDGNPNKHESEVESENKTFDFYVSASLLALTLNAFEGEALQLFQSENFILLQGGDLKVIVMGMKG